MKNTFWTVCLIFGLYVPVISQNTLTIDLASEPTGTLSLPLQTGDHTIILKNRLPGKNYSIIVEVEDVQLEPFSMPSKVGKAAFASNCDSLKSIVQLINQLDSEAELPAKRVALSALMIPANVTCSAYGAALKMDSTFDSRYEIYGLKKSQILKITVKRINKAGTELEWVRIYKTPSRGKWLTSYSFIFIWPSLGKERLFFAKNIGMDSFQIASETNRKWMDFAPGITFTWLPSEGFKKDISFGVSGGIGFDLEKPVVFVGGSVMYNQNLSLTIGVAAHRVKALNGKYKEGDIIRENLSPDQLLIEPYRVNPFVSLSFRFDKNPFP